MLVPPLSNSWIINMIWLYIDLNMTPSIDCYWVGAVLKVYDFWNQSPEHPSTAEL